MAVIKIVEYKGVTITVHDDAYRDAPPEEIERRRRETARIAREIAIDAYKGQLAANA